MTFYYCVGGIVLHVYVFSDCNPFSEGGKKMQTCSFVFLN